MKSIKKLSLLISLLTFLSILSLSLFSVPVKALTTSDVYQASPPGLALNDYMDYVTNYSRSGKTMSNSVKIYQANSSEYNNPYDIIQLMNGTDKTQLSSIWGTRSSDGTSKSDNYFDLKQNQSISAWIYMGGNDPYKDVNDPGTATGLPDGMAFVLQNDAQGKNAISYSVKDGNFATGETLGVWGNALSTYGSNTSILSIGAGAIKNSFAIEFDTLRNGTAATSSNLTDDYFDGMKLSGSYQARGQHIAWNYPNGATQSSSENGVIPVGNTTPYFGNKYSGLFSATYYYGLNHFDPIINLYMTGATSVNEAWRHFSLDYTKPDPGSSIATIHYILNDKDYDGSVKPSRLWDHRTIKVDISKLVDTTSTNDDDYKIRWGFTASTGSKNSAPAPFAVVMQQMPNVANIDATTTLFDLSQYNSDGVLGREISDLDKKSSSESSNLAKYNVANGDKLRFDYNLNYLSGFAGTGNEIKTVLKLPSSVDFSVDPDTELGQSGAVGQIIYTNFENDDNNKTIPIYASDITTDSNGDKVINLTLQEMNLINENTKIELFGKADADNTPTTVLGEHISFNSMHYIDDAMSTSFIINDRLQLKTNDDLDLGTINTKDVNNNQVNLNLTMDYQKNSKFDKNNVTLYTKVDDNAPTSTVISTADQQTSYDIANNIGNSTQLTAEYLGVGEHTIKVYAVDYLGRTTDAITYTVNVEGTQLKLDVDPTYSFKTINSQASSGYVQRQGNWKVNVISTDTPWTLSATAEPLTLESDRSQVLGPIIFRDKAGNEQTLDGQSPKLAFDDNSDPSSKITNVSGNWNNTDGLLLQTRGVNQAGTYTTTIEWNLINSL